MLTIQSILGRVRVAVHDTDGITYDDDEIVAVINAGLRFVRRTIMTLQPELLSETVSGELAAGENVVVLEKRPSAIVEVTAGDKVRKTVTTYGNDLIYHNYEKIFQNHTLIYSRVDTLYYDEKPIAATNMRHIRERYEEGTPVAFYRTGPRTFHFMPIPTATTAYTIRFISDLEELTIDDTSPLETDMDDFLIEYATIRLSIGNEYDVSQEQVIMGSIVSQIQQMLYPPPPGVRVRGYWDPIPVRGGGYR